MKPRKKTRKYPVHFHVKGKACYHVYKAKWIPIGSLDDLPTALEEWAKVERTIRAPGDGKSIADICERFVDFMTREDNPFSYAPKTIKERARILRRDPPSTLNRAFGHIHIDALRAFHVAEYLDMHPSPVSANREITALSRVYRWAIRKGYVTTDNNPCLIDKNPEQARKRYVEDDEYLAVRNMRADIMACMMDISLLTAWREMDVALILLKGIKENELVQDESKEGLRGRVSMSPALAAVIARAKALRPSVASPYLFVHPVTCKPYNEDQVKGMWQRRIKKAVKDGLIKERFTFHDIRAKHASDRQDGLSQLALGHTHPKMTKKYIRNAKGRAYEPLDTNLLDEDK